MITAPSNQNFKAVAPRKIKGKLDNTYHLYEKGGRKWIVLCLEWGPRDKVVAWAVLRVGGQTVAYYRTTSGSIGFQAGAQAKSIVIAFLTQASLDQFRKSSGWKAGIDGSIALIDVGVGKTIDTDNVRDPVVGFVFGSKGLMYNLTFEGTRFTKLTK